MLQQGIAAQASQGDCDVLVHRWLVRVVVMLCGAVKLSRSPLSGVTRRKRGKHAREVGSLSAAAAWEVRRPAPPTQTLLGAPGTWTSVQLVCSLRALF